MSIDPSMDYQLAVQSGNAEAIDIASKALNSGQPQPKQTTTTAVDSAETTYWQNRAMSEAADKAALQNEQRATASSFLRTILTQYNMGELADSVDQLVGQWGSNTTVIAENLRQTQSYKERFKGLIDLQAKGVTDIQNEGEYLNLESQYRQVFRDAGQQNFLGEAGSSTERNAIADIVNKYSLSVNEVKSRVDDATRIVAADATTRDAMQRYYNVDPATLVSYVLDPARTSAKINEMANAAIVGGAATQQGLSLGAEAAGRIGSLRGGTGNLGAEQVSPELSQAAAIQTATSRLANIENTDLTAEESALSAFNLDATAEEKIRGLQSRERARFGGSSGFGKGSLSRPSAL